MNTVARTLLAMLALPVADAGAQARLPIIDMHLHIRKADYIGPNPPAMCTPFTIMPRWDNARSAEQGFEFNEPPCENPIPAATTDSAVMNGTIEVMRRRNIIGMVSGEPEEMVKWQSVAGDRIIPGLDLRIGSPSGASHVKTRTPAEIRGLHSRGAFTVLGEVLAQYQGVAANDERLAPYWALAEELGIPVAIHMGSGGPADPYLGSPGFRARNSSPLLLEEVLVKHPRLRVYIMHAGYPMLDDLRALLFVHPQVYVEVGSIVYAEPRAAFYRYLEGIVEAGYADRVMFGSDQMIWPGIIEPSIQAIEDAPFLSAQQKRDILYNNAARFLRLSKKEIAKHHSM